MQSASTKTKLLCETEIDRALNSKLDIFTLLLLHRLSLQKEMLVSLSLSLSRSLPFSHLSISDYEDVA